MKNLPIKEGIEKHLVKYGHEGVWKVKDKEMYVKLTSKLHSPPTKINPDDYDNFNDALEDTITCAKVYKKLIKEGLYPPNTQVAICKDNKGYLTLMVTMPELKTPGDTKSIDAKLQDIIKSVGLDSPQYSFRDLRSAFTSNWGYDKKTNKLYAHDLHLAYSTKEILSMAKDLGYKK